MVVTNAIVPGSLGAMAKRDGTSIAESFLSADVICVVDVSGSMDQHDSRGGKRRYDVACEELQRIQNDMPGRIAVVSFSDSAQFCPGGVPVFQRGGTNLTGALKFVKIADGTVRFIVISDGMPNNSEEALKIAQTFSSQIDVVYVGAEDDPFGGQEFLRKLASASGGRYTVASKAHDLADKVNRLMLGSSDLTHDGLRVV